MLRGMTSHQLWEWRAYADLEPFDEERADLRAAQICMLLAEVNRDPKKRPQPYTLKDFLFNFAAASAPVKEQTWQEQKALFRQAVGSKRKAPPRQSKKARLAAAAAATEGTSAT